MKKILLTFITWFLVTIIVIGIFPFVKAQTNSSPQPTSSTSAPVVFDGETLFFINNRIGSLSPQLRSQRLSRRIAEFANDYKVSLDDLKVTSVDEEGIGLSAIIAGSNLITLISEQDGKMVGKTRTELANEYLQKIRLAVEKYRKERSFERLLQGAIFSLIATLILLFSLFITNNLFAIIYQRLRAWGDSQIHAVRLGNLELIRENQLDNVIAFVTRIIQIIIILTLLIFYFPFVFKQFPWTRELANIIWGHFTGILGSGWQAFINYLPNLLTIILVITIAYFLENMAKYFFRELSQETISLLGFYPEWAWPTYRLVTVLIIILLAVIIFPLLPGFQSPAFQGISVFLGLLISLGSSSVISNIISGTVLIYTRAFRIGDCVKVGELYGQVIENTLLVTRILTTTNDVISIPNSVVINSSIENLNFAAKELNIPLMVKTTIYLGYEVPWRQAYEALTQAALRTNGVAKSPLPYILQEKLNEVHVTYFLKVYIDLEYFKGKKIKELEQINSQLHENIRDCCSEAGIKIFAPNYEADPTNYGPAS